MLKSALFGVKVENNSDFWQGTVPSSIPISVKLFVSTSV
jgi:hypothetical protein